MLPIILASSSPFRRELLNKLGLPFTCHSPDIDETAKAGESPEALVERLALEKAHAVARKNSKSLIIASDQVAVLNGQIMTKPHTHTKAVEQLTLSSGNSVHFLTSLCLFNSQTQNAQIIIAPYAVEFLSLTQEQIEAYLKKEQPYQCAGSFKSEGLGISLFSKMEGEDPNSLIGLPLIQLTQMLRNEGVEPLS
ncbi:Maf family protein [Eionea flava]